MIGYLVNGELVSREEYIKILGMTPEEVNQMQIEFEEGCEG